MKKSFIFIVVCLVTFQIYSQTYVGGVQSENSTWIKVNNPYIVNSNYLIPANIELNIEAGVEIFFEENLGMEISGLLRANGNSTDTILFTGYNNGDWNGLTFNNSCVPFDSITGEGTILSYCKFSGNGYQPVWMIRSYGCSMEVSNSLIENTERGFISYWRSNIRFIKNIVRNTSTYAFYCYEQDGIAVNDGYVIVRENEVYNSSVIEFFTGAVVENNYFHDFNGEGIDFRGIVIWPTYTDNQEYKFCGNTLKNFENEALTLRHIGNNNVDITCNTFTDNGINLYVDCNYYSGVDNLLFEQNNLLNYQDYNIRVYSPDGCDGSGSYDNLMVENNYWNNLSENEIRTSIWDFDDDYTTGVKAFFNPVLTSATDCTCGNASGVNNAKSDSEKNVIIYPNPINYSATIKIINQDLTKNQKEIYLSLYDMFGSEIIKNKNINSNQIILYKNNLKEGIYFYKISTNEKIIDAGKLIIN